MDIVNASNQLSILLGERFTQSKSELDAHAGSESYFPKVMPDGIAYPTSTDEVAQLVKICAKFGVPVVGWGAGTSLEGHAQAIQGGIVVDFRHMASVIKLNAEDMCVTVQPGLTREDLNIYLRESGLFFPVDPGANATIGGMAATRASGTTAVRYGTMRQNVLATKTVVADGRVIDTGTSAPKSSAGYDLTSLIVGSEGTLGLMTEITVRLHPQPEAISAAVCGFDDMQSAVSAVTACIQMGIPLARIEFLDRLSVAAANAYAKTDFPNMPHLMLEFHGSEARVAEDAQISGEIMNDFGGTGFKWSNEPSQRRALWTMRHNAYYACLALRPGARAIVTDICVPISKLAQAVTECAKDIADAGLVGPILGHVGDGNFHAILLVEEDNAAELALAKSVSARMIDRSLALGGTMSGEHGVGMGKLDFMAAEHGDGWSIMTEIKRALDPKNIMNPGKIVRLN